MVTMHSTRDSTPRLLSISMVSTLHTWYDYNYRATPVPSRDNDLS